MSSRQAVAARRAAPYCALLLFTLLFYRNILFTSDTFIPFDLPFYHLPQAVFASESLRNGQLPLWDPNTYCGRPLYAEVQAAYFYPARMLTILLVGPAPHVKLLRALEIELVVHVFLAGVFTLWLARRMGLSGPAALMSASIYPLAWFASQAEHIGLIESFSWLPLAWLGVMLVIEKATFGRFLLLSVTLALILLAGFTPAAIVIFMSVGALAVLWAVFFRSGVKPVLFTVAAGLTACVLATIQLIPTVQLSALSIGHLRDAWKGTGGGFRLEVLKTLIWPNALGVFSWATFNPKYEITFSYIYCGIVALGLAVVALFVKPSRVKFAVIALAGISGIWMIGDKTPIGRTLFLMLPRFIQGPFYPEDWMGVFPLCLALLSGFGLQRFAVLKRWGYVLVLASATDLIVAGSNRPMNTTRYDPDSIALDRAIDGERSALATMRRVAAAQVPAYRIDGKADDAWGAWALLTGVPSANGIDPLSVTRLLEARKRLHSGGLWAFHTVEYIEPRILSFLNVRYFMTREPLTSGELSRSKFILAGTFPGRLFYENPNVLPRFFFVRHLTPSFGEAESIRLIDREAWDPSQGAVVEGIDRPRDALADGTVQVAKYGDEEVTLRVHSNGEGFLVSSEVHYPGWHAVLDGKEIPIYYSNVAFRGVFVPSGEHSIVFKFRPAALVEGALVSLLAVAALCLGGYLSGGKRAYWTRLRWQLSLALFRAARAVRPLRPTECGNSHPL